MQTRIADIEVRAPFKDLFPVDPVTLAAISESIQQDGFDGSKPLDLWGTVLVDGHTRLLAAVACGLETVETFNHEFQDEDAALEYAIRNQRDRRNMTAGDILRCVAALDRRASHGGDRRSDAIKASGDALKPGKSAVQTAEILRVSPATVERARAVNDYASPATKQAVETGELSLAAAASPADTTRKPKRAQAARPLSRRQSRESAELVAFRAQIADLQVTLAALPGEQKKTAEAIQAAADGQEKIAAALGDLRALVEAQAAEIAGLREELQDARRPWWARLFSGRDRENG